MSRMADLPGRVVANSWARPAGGKGRVVDVALNDGGYTPERLLESLMAQTGARDMTALGCLLNIDGGQLSRLKRRLDPLTAVMIVRILDGCPDLTIADVRRLAGAPIPE